MATEGLILKVSIKMPKFRLKVFAAAIAVLGRGHGYGLVSEAMANRIANAIWEWVKRGLKTHVV